jgi:Zn finger protein HypA/HybF involved in hydrogenase expression
MSDETLRLDGNAAAGMLAEIFPFEMTNAECTCATCGRSGPLGSLLLYGGIMGTILRCPTCEQVQLRIAHVRGRYMIDMRGMKALQIAPALLA